MLLQRSVEEWPDICDGVQSYVDDRPHPPMMANWKKREPGTWPNTRTSVRYGKLRHDSEQGSSKTFPSNRGSKVSGKLFIYNGITADKGLS